MQRFIFTILLLLCSLSPAQAKNWVIGEGITATITDDDLIPYVDAVAGIQAITKAHLVEQITGTTAGTVAAGDDSRITGALQPTGNGSGLSGITAGQVSFIQSGTGAIPRTGQEKLREMPGLTPQDMGVIADGVTSASVGLDAWLTELCTQGGDGWVPGGDYLLTSSIQAALSASVKIRVSPKARFLAAPGINANRMIWVITGTGNGHIFDWEGGQFDGANIPNSLPGEANDIFSVNAENADTVRVILDKTYTGDNWTTSGGDSHLFIGGANNVEAAIRFAQGSVDAAIYISGNADGSRGQSLKAWGTFKRCNVGIIVKRAFELWNVDADVIECSTGVAGGGVGLGTLLPGDGCKIRVNALRTTIACALQAVTGGIVDVVSREMGAVFTGYSATAAQGLQLSGAKGIMGRVVCQGVNPLLTADINFVGVKAERRTFEDASIFEAENNFIQVNVIGIGQPVNEAATCSKNIFIVKQDDITSGSAILGTNSSMQLYRTLGYGLELDTSAVSVGGQRGTEALLVLKLANQVNKVRVDGAIAGAASGVGVAAYGSDANIPLRLNSQGTSPLLIGGTAGAESVRVQKVASQVNAIELYGAVAGQPPSIKTRGSDANSNLSLSGKGTGSVVVSGALSAPALEVALAGTTPTALTTLQAAGTLLYSTSTTTQDVTLPTIAAGMNFCYQLSEDVISGNSTLTSAATMYLNGVATGTDVINTSWTIMDEVCCHAARDAAQALVWSCKANLGVWE